ncbi:MFS general substrate transporter [Choiromyces venosus 120613-1]|uniref:MFS general substrate transporter n=1 Tax=Choiromyces venosus 120613-1 TaxID=1336337 RepID=A0A3N4JU61_9PEZI|nr:MFS general substrate transporter [Choiromyces venosus 120613-1]
MAMCAFLGPGLGPIVGAMFGTWWLVPESHPQTLLARKARELRKKTGIEGLYTEVQRNGLRRSRTFITAIWRPLQLLAFEPIVFLTSLFVSFIWGILYLYLGAYIIVFRTRYGWGEAKAGAAFGGIAIGILLAGGMAGMANKIFVRLSEKNAKNGPFPEGRLPPAMLAAILVPASMFWFAWTGFTHVHWAVPVASGIPFGWCMVMLFISFATYASDSFPHIAASVGAANSLLRCLFAMSFPLVTPKLYGRFAPEWAETILAFITLLFIPVPFLFWKYGPWLRSKSKFQSKFL